MGANQVKEDLYGKIENSDEQGVANIIRVLPQVFSTALTRSVWRNDFKLVQLLLGMGCDINYAGPRGITPLMWAAKRGHVDMAKFLLENGADLHQRSANTDCITPTFTALESAISMGQYEMSLYLLSLDLKQLETLPKIEEFEERSKGKYLSYINFQLFIDHLRARIPFEACPNFFKKPKEPELIDPVIDPRETWGQFFKRNIDFEEPPKVERSELPLKLQPQNRFLGRIRSYLNGQSPFPAENKTSIKIPSEKQHLEMQDQLPDNRVIEDGGNLNDPTYSSFQPSKTNHISLPNREINI